MPDTDPNPTAAAPATAETPATAAPAPVETAAAEPVSEPVKTVSRAPDMPQQAKDGFRKALPWIMAELDFAREGKTAEERAVLNP